MEKRGEMTATMIVSILLVLAGFVIIALVIYNFNLDDYSDDELCHLSVVSRASAPGKGIIVGQAQGYVPLKCTTNKICLSDSKECNQFIGEEKVERIKLLGDEDKQRTQIEEATVEAMYDCWNVMGQGKLDVFPSSVTEKLALEPKKAPYCVICSRVAVDGGENFDADTLRRVNLLRYMENHQTYDGTGLTYMEIFTDKDSKTISAYYDKDSEFGLTQEQLANLTSEQRSEYESKRREVAVVFMQYKTENFEDILSSWSTVGNIAIAGTAFAGPGKILATATKLPVLGAAAVVAGGTALYGYYNYEQNQKIAAGYCGKFSSGDEKSEGCSSVQVVNYDYKSINELCGGVIQGNP